MMYLWLKSVHVVFVVVWMAGMLATPLILRALGDLAEDQRAQLRRTFNQIVTPAMIAALCVGIWLAVSGSWFSDAWLRAKLVLVIVLTGFHGAMSGALRRWASDPTQSLPRWFSRAHLITTALLTLIVLLVIRKSIV